eukprot:111885-Rhodomonas_salina.4
MHQRWVFAGSRRVSSYVTPHRILCHVTQARRRRHVTSRKRLGHVARAYLRETSLVDAAASYTPPQHRTLA